MSILVATWPDFPVATWTWLKAGSRPLYLYRVHSNGDVSAHQLSPKDDAARRLPAREHESDRMVILRHEWVGVRPVGDAIVSFIKVVVKSVETKAGRGLVGDFFYSLYFRLYGK